MECRKLPAFQPENLRQGFSQDMVTEARKRRKINQVNCTVCQTLYLCSLCMHDSILAVTIPYVKCSPKLLPAEVWNFVDYFDKP